MSPALWSLVSAARQGSVQTEVLHEPAPCVDAEPDGAQIDEVGEVEVRSGRDVRARTGQHGSVEPKQSVQ